MSRSHTHTKGKSAYQRRQRIGRKHPPRDTRPGTLARYLAAPDPSMLPNPTRAARLAAIILRGAFA